MALPVRSRLQVDRLTDACDARVGGANGYLNAGRRGVVSRVGQLHVERGGVVGDLGLNEDVPYVDRAGRDKPDRLPDASGDSPSPLRSLHPSNALGLLVL